ncbi:MAG: tetratricopeptide repeat protein [Prevotellaceae bacterium]|nr:tetratricopeptide repeat protein [Prevotellaceae bacterium]
MKIVRRFLLLLAAACLAGGVQAQQTAVKQVADGHYMGAKHQLEQYLEAADEKGWEEAEALLLVCGYVLDTRGVADEIGGWVEAHPLSQYAEVLNVLRRNLLIKEERTDEALELFFREEGKSVSVPLAYPLTELSDEMSSYNGVLYRLAGENLYDKGQYGRALPYLEAGEKTRTSLYKLGMCYYNEGVFDKAHATLVGSAGADRDEMAQNAWLHAGIAALQKGQKADAQRAFGNASQMSANAVLREQALYNYSLTLHEQSSPQTVAVMEQFLSEYPQSQYATPVSLCLTEVYMTKKDYSKALNTINKVQTPDADTQADKQKVLYNLAFQELNRNRLQDAITYASQAIALGNHDVAAYAECYYIKGDCNYRLGNYQQAANDLNTAIQLGSQTAQGRLKNHEYAVYSYAYANFKLQKYNAAISLFQQVAGMPSASRAMVADAYNRIGDCYLNMRNYDEAVANYEKAKATDHSLGDYSMLQEAYIEGLRGNYDRKVEIINQMNNEYRSSSLAAKALYEQGRAYVLSGRNTEATAVFSSIVVKYPQSEYAQKASEELQTMAANIAMQDSIAAAQDSIATEEAKAPVLAAQALYEQGLYQQAEQQLNAAIDNGIGKPYWLARAFVLLSDIYKAEGRAVEAKQTLESLKANYNEEDDIMDMINERLQ